MKIQIHVISDGTGKTAERLLNSALVQFEEVQQEIIIHSGVRTEVHIKNILESIICDKCFVVHTIVSFELRNQLIEIAKHLNIQAIDFMGPVLSQLSSQLSLNPIEKPGVFHELNKAYFQRIDAIEFAIKHDDGLRTENLMQADIVLLGVSRTFKTPLSIYLANLGWLTANIPLIVDIPVPEILNELPPEKVFCLTTTPIRLSMLRQVRDVHLHNQVGDYATVEHTKKELTYAKFIFSRHPGWTVVDVTNKSIEEIASKIISKIKGDFVADMNKE